VVREIPQAVQIYLTMRTMVATARAGLGTPARPVRVRPWRVNCWQPWRG